MSLWLKGQVLWFLKTVEHSKRSWVRDSVNASCRFLNFYVFFGIFEFFNSKSLLFAEVSYERLLF